MIQRQIQRLPERWLRYLPGQPVPMLDHPNSEETPLGVLQLSLFRMILCNLNLPSFSVLGLFPGPATAGTSPHLTTLSLHVLIQQVEMVLSVED